MSGQTIAARRVLIVEDHEDTADSLSLLLKLIGHSVTVSRNLEGAKRAVAQGEFDVIFCDIALPDGKGTALPPVVKSLHPRTKLVALTGSGMAHEVHGILAAGFDTHILKPPGIEELYKQLA